MYRQTSNIRRSLVENKLAYHSLYPPNNEKNTPLVLPADQMFCVQYRVIFDCNMSRVYSEMMMKMMMMMSL